MHAPHVPHSSYAPRHRAGAAGGVSGRPEATLAAPPDREPHGVGRRAVLKGAAVGAIGLTGAYTLTRSPAAAAVAPRAARSAESVADAFGVCVHFNFQNSVYGDEHAVAAKMADLGARHARSRLVPRLDGVRRGFTALAEANCQVDGVCQVFNDSTQPSATDLMQEVREYYGGESGGVFSFFEGINEPNNDGIPWVAETRQRTKDLWLAAKSSGQTDNIPIIGPSLADTWTLQEDYQQLGDLTQWTDLGSIHLYPRGVSPSILIDQHQGYAQATYGDQPFACTEGGYNNTLSSPTLRPVPEDVAGVYGPRHLMEHYSRGNRFFRYELLDDVDPHKVEWESNFGLVAVASNNPSTWRDKPAFTAMKNFLAVVGDRGGLSYQAQPLTMSITGGGPDLRSSLVQRRDGTHYLILWRDVNVYDPASKQYLDVEMDPFTVTFAQEKRMRVFVPSRQADATRDVGTATSVDMSLRGLLKVLEIAPA